MEKPRYRQIVRAVSETPWAILPSKLAAIINVLELRLAGVELSEEEIRERIGAARQREQRATAGGIAVLPVYGSIFPRANLMSEVSGGVSMEQFQSDLAALVADKSIGTIILDIDSPGGAVDLVPEAAAAVRAATKKKHVVAFANTMIASAAYWLAAQASEIVSTPSGEVGSIGIIAAHESVARQLDAQGVDVTLITAKQSPFKAEANPFEALTDEARADIQRTVDAFGEMFVTAVATGRGVEQQRVLDSFGGGRMLLARDALRVGMIDRIESFDQMVARLSGDRAVKRGARAEVDTTERTFAVERLGIGRTDVADALADKAEAHDWQLLGNLPPLPEALVGAEENETELTSTEEVVPTAQSEPEAEQAPNEPTSRESAVSTPNLKNEEKDKMDEYRSIADVEARLAEIESRRKELHAEIGLTAGTADQNEEFDALSVELEQLEKIRADYQRRQSILEAGGGAEDKPRTDPRVNRRTTKAPQDFWALEDYRRMAGSVDELPELYKEGAKRALEAVEYPTISNDKASEHISKLIAKDRRGAVAARVLATGSPLYDRAFGKWLAQAPLNGPERDALAQAKNVMASLSLTDGDGGYAVPFTLDPTVLPTSDGSVNPLRSISRNIQISGNTWKGVSSDGVSASYGPEATEASDGSPSLDQPEIHVEKAQCFVPFSIEIGEDWAGMRAELALMIQDAKDAEEADKFINGAGHGSTEPEGVVAGLGGGSVVATGTSNTFDVSDLYLLRRELPPRFRGRAAYVCNSAVIDAVREQTGDQFDVYVRLAHGPNDNASGDTGLSLLGKPLYEAEDMSDDLTTDNSKVLLTGDFRYYAIVDRVGLNVELIPHLFGTGNNFPTGSRGIYAYWRNSAGILSDNAFRLLKIKPT